MTFYHLVALLKGKGKVGRCPSTDCLLGPGAQSIHVYSIMCDSEKTGLRKTEGLPKFLGIREFWKKKGIIFDVNMI